ncbi:MAG: preprotein translocase subunit YajC [Bacteroidota bacterium]
MDVFFLMAQPGAEPNPIATFLPLVLIFVVFYFFIIRPQRKKEDERKSMIEAVKKGDKVITIGGLYGNVTQIDESSLLVQVDTNTKLRVEKNAIARVEQK